ncbi:MAG: hypothetical protein CK533_01905 [Acidobacterium sp.]|nr:ABC transporter permease [Acidobacteriota bacterium]PHY12047.1 MAG: hypothetical protein CK533_01905 [Acidobacterium sp.]
MWSAAPRGAGYVGADGHAVERRPRAAAPGAGCRARSRSGGVDASRRTHRVVESGSRNPRRLLRPGGGRDGRPRCQRSGRVRTIWIVAGASFKESVRDRVPYTMVVFAVLMIAASYLLSELTAGQDLKIVKDLGLAAMSTFGLVIAVFIGIGLVSKEVERKSVFGLLTKPVSRTQFILGKYLGLVTTLAVNLTVMTLAYYAVLFYMDVIATAGMRASWAAPALDPRQLVAIVLIMGQLAMVTAVALLFSTFSSPLLSALLTSGLWVAGHFNGDLRQFEQVVDQPAVAWIARALYYLLPNLAPFNVRAEVVYGLPVSASHVGFTLLYALSYSSALLVAAVAIFRRRDFK